MNSNLFRYSNRFMAVAAAAAIFASCEKDQFTEKNALDLDLMRLRVQDNLADSVRMMQHEQQLQLLRHQRMIDSLMAIDAGGKVYYSVIPYDGTLGVAASGGRVEGIKTATVTAFIGQPKGTTSNDGKTYTPITQTALNSYVVKASNNSSGVYAFPAMYSGETTVSIEAPGYSTLNYTANLTPDGPVANGKVVYVGNVLPLFSNGDGDNTTTFTKTARIRGKAHIETNLTNGIEEGGNGELQGYAVTAQIDTERGNVFRTRFITEANDENGGVGAGNNGSHTLSKSGFIQRFAYEFANINRTTVGSNGDYAMLVPASMSGLPIKLEYDEWTADRIFFRNDKPVTARHIYGPNVKADDVANGVTQPSLTFQAVQTAATATVAYTAASTSTTLHSGTTNTLATRIGTFGAWGLGVGSPTVSGTGGSGATATVQLNSANAAANRFDAFSTVSGTITAGGTGFTGTGTITFTYTDHLSIGTLTQQSVQGGGGISPFIRVRNGGFNFFPTASTLISQSGQFTNRLPDVLFAIGGQSVNQITGVTAPTARVVIDQSVGAVSFISVITPGSGFGTTPPSVVFGYETNALTLTGSSTTPIFITTNTNGALSFASSGFTTTSLEQALIAASVGNGTVANHYTLSANGGTLEFLSASQARYTFVPNVTFQVLLNGTPVSATLFTQPTIGVEVMSDPNSVYVGGIKRVTMTGGSNFGQFFNGSNLRPEYSISVSFRSPTNTLAAYDTQLTGTGLNNYFFDATPPTPTGSNGKQVYNFSFTNAGSNPGNINQQIANTASALALVTSSQALVVADAPTAAIANPRRAYGVPVYDNGVIAGIRMLDGGSGYEGNRNYVLHIIPNPFWAAAGTGHVSNPSGTIVRVTDGTTTIDAEVAAAADNATTQNVGHVAWGLVQARYNVSTANKQGSITGYPLVANPASVTVTLTNRGSGYAEDPSIVLFDGGLPFNASQELSKKIDARLFIRNSVGSSFPSPSTIGELTFGGTSTGGYTVNADGTVLTYNGSEVPGNGTGTVPSAGVSYNTTTGAVKAIIIDRLGETLTNEFKDMSKVAGEIRINELGQISAIDVSAGRPIAFQTVNGVSFNTAKGWMAFTPLTYNVAPTLTIASVTGTGAVAVINPAISTLPGTNPINGSTGLNPIWVSGNKQDGTGVAGNTNADYERIGFQIRNITVTNGGSGYQQGNWYHNSGFTGTGTTINGDNSKAPYTSASAASQNFRVIGGVQGANFDLNESNASERNDRFDVFPGNTYVRDIHLGTGHEVE